MKKITEALISSMARDYIETCLDRSEDFFYEYIRDISEQEDVDSDELADKFSSKLNRVLKAVK